MSSLLVLGNCATQTAECEATNFILRAGGETVLFDAGPGVMRQLYRAGVSAAEIGLIVITHSHGDHSLGFPYFLFSLFVERTQGKSGPDVIPVIALPSVYEGLMQMFAFCYPPGKYPMFKTENWEASESDGSEYAFADLKIRTTPVSHTVPTIAVRFSFNSTSITLSSDTIYDERLVDLAKGSDILVHEAFGPSALAELGKQSRHGITTDAARVARDAKVKKLMLCHWLASFKNNPEVLVKEAADVFKGEIVAPKELQEITL